ncbi:hypothetical protein QMK17_25105 [Rhodococcus sp. G-MC3]|uniref:hypothetical protein n=1 Tax=Rhodococcus sp. G-MC3 TaxID=3046209 RepID=UPI0024BA0C5C|nr:hypothetical protein [Rhodococcus sp. G-MC3]MDJ0396584.1 hypothetical protein [Rhodococcus sp. G-MC3]
MKTRLLIATIGAITGFTLSAYGSADTSTTDDLATTSASSATVNAAPTTTAALPPVTTTTDEPAALPAPVTFECGDFSLYQSGTALYSDGTTGYEPSCDTYQPPAEKILWYCDYPQTAVYTDGTSSSTDPACIHDEPQNPGGGYPYIASEDRNGDGIVNCY